MQGKYVSSIRLRTCDCDLFQGWRPGAILESMQETAGEHSAMLGLSRAVMDDIGIAWVLSRVKAAFERQPKAGEILTVETYPTPNRHLFFPRTHIFRDEAGVQVGAANSLWMLLDVASRRVTNSDFVLERMPDNRELKSVLGMPATVRPLEGDKRSAMLTPQFTEFDPNHHVNNTKYMDWCMNALGLEYLQENWIQSFDINYDAEILPGSEVRTELACADGRFSFLGFEGEKTAEINAGYFSTYRAEDHCRRKEERENALKCCFHFCLPLCFEYFLLNICKRIFKPRIT